VGAASVRRQTALQIAHKEKTRTVCRMSATGSRLSPPHSPCRGTQDRLPRNGMGSSNSR